MLLQEVLLDADADMTAATLKTKLDASGPDARQDHAHNPLPPSQDKQPDLSAQSHVQTQQDASADTHSQLPARELESEQGNAEIVARMTVAQKMGTEGAFMICTQRTEEGSVKLVTKYSIAITIWLSTANSPAL